MHGHIHKRQELLIEANIGWLLQAGALLDGISDATYLAIPLGLAPHKAGSHLRHILEFYECFLSGLASSHIDYDSRKRDLSVEANRQAAQERICSIIRRFEDEPALRTDSIVWVRMEDSAESDVPAPLLVSSVGRELQVLSSHTIHHFALMAVVLRALGVPVDTEFGMAPSTLRFMSSRSTAEAA